MSVGATEILANICNMSSCFPGHANMQEDLGVLGLVWLGKTHIPHVRILLPSSQKVREISEFQWTLSQNCY